MHIMALGEDIGHRVSNSRVKRFFDTDHTIIGRTLIQ